MYYNLWMWLIFQYLKWLSNFIMYSEINNYSTAWVSHTRPSNMITFLLIWYANHCLLVKWIFTVGALPVMRIIMRLIINMYFVIFQPVVSLQHRTSPFVLVCRYGLQYWYVGMACSISWRFYNVACWWCFVMLTALVWLS